MHQGLPLIPLIEEEKQLAQEYQSESNDMLLLVYKQMYVQFIGLKIQCRLWLEEFSGEMQLDLTIGKSII